MINRRCPNPECGSSHTYAVPSRAIVKTDAEGKIEYDEKGMPLKIMCRRCRNCGQDYFDDGKFKPSAGKNDTELGKHVRELAAQRGIIIK